jgi:hypothetical protein
MKQPLINVFLVIMAILFMFSAAIPDIHSDHYTYEASLSFRLLFVSFSLLAIALMVKTQ